MLPVVLLELVFMPTIRREICSWKGPEPGVGGQKPAPGAQPSPPAAPHGVASKPMDFPLFDSVDEEGRLIISLLIL